MSDKKYRIMLREKNDAIITTDYYNKASIYSINDVTNLLINDFIISKNNLLKLENNNIYEAWNKSCYDYFRNQLVIAYMSGPDHAGVEKI